MKAIHKPFKKQNNNLLRSVSSSRTHFVGESICLSVCMSVRIYVCLYVFMYTTL